MTSQSLVDAVVRLRENGLSDKKIAAELGLTKGQVSGIFWRARSELYASRLGGSPDEIARRAVARYAAKAGVAEARRLLSEMARAL